jgi:hypothetical protein
VEVVNLFKSQSQKIYLRANAIKGLAEYRALQSRFHGSVNYVEAFEASKLALGNDFILRKIPYKKADGQANPQVPKVEISQLL